MYKEPHTMTPFKAALTGASRRNFAIAAAASPVAACSLFTPANVATVESVIAKIQAAMPWINAVASLGASLIPGGSAVLAVVEDGITAASNVFNTMSSTMSAAAAQPLVGQIATSIGGALTAAKQIAAALPAKAQATANGLLAQADTVIADLNAFVSPAAPVAPGAVLRVAPTGMFIRKV
jgi:hypothetical protein